MWRWSPQPPRIFRVFTRKTLISAYFLSKKDTRVPASGLNLPLLALLVDLRYSISIFVCRLVVTENIRGGGAISPLPPFLATPLDVQDKRIPIESRLFYCIISLEPVTMNFDEVLAFFQFFKHTGKITSHPTMAYSSTGLTDICGVEKTGGHCFEKPLRNCVLAHTKKLYGRVSKLMVHHLTSI